MPSLQHRKSKTPKFCVSLLPKNEQELKTQLLACRDADLIELRLDWLKELHSDLISQYRNMPVIIAVRAEDEGGFFSGAPSEMINICQNAIDVGFDYIDISHSTAGSILHKLKSDGSTKIILSSHTKENDIDLLKKELKRMRETKADVYKLVFTANSLSDNITILQLIDFAKELNIPFIIHAQGDMGKLSRLIGSFRGNIWTYVSLSEDQKTAPGQLSLHEAKYRYFLQEKNSLTKILGLVGYPVAQSKGWLLFNKIFHLGGRDRSAIRSPLNYIYLNFPIGDIAQFWEVWHNQLNALSVTIPHKENILKYAAYKSQEAEQSGVCNTLIKKNNSWEAHNTDLLAMVELLKPYKERLKKGAALVYGTGATTRSAIVALRRLDVQNILVLGRNKERGRMLADLFSIKFVKASAVPSNLSAIIQTTPVGMHPYNDQTPECIEFLKSDIIAFDIVFNPPFTPFLQFAKETGCITISGEEMYLRQAALQFELFTGRGISISGLKEIWSQLI